MSRRTEPERRRPVLQDTGALIAARVQARLSPKQLAEKAGISLSHLCEIEKGHRSPSTEYLARIADALGKPVTDLLNPALTTAGGGPERAA